MENVVDRFYNKFLKYKEQYNRDFLENKIKKIFNETTLKNKISYFLIYNSTLDENILSERIFSNDEKEYFLRMKKEFSVKEFKDILLKNNINKDIYLKEYFQSYVAIGSVMLRFGKITDISLFKKIIYLWILVDNITDDPEIKDKKSLLKNVFLFFETLIYKKKELEILEFFDSNKEDFIISIFKQIYEKLEPLKRVSFFDCTKDLFQFSYSHEGLKKEKNSKDKELIRISMMKTFYSFRIFSYCLEKGKENVPKEEYFTTSLMLQLIDDLIDLKKDIEEGSNTFITRASLKERTIIILIIIEIEMSKKREMEKYIISIFLALIENKDLFEKDLFDVLKEALQIDLYSDKFKNTSEFFESINS